MTPLLESKNFAFANEFHQRGLYTQNNPDRYFTELVEIFINKGNLDREELERCMSQQFACLRDNFANVAKTFAQNYYSALSSDTEGARAQFDVLMKALRHWEREESTESSQCLMLNLLVVHGLNL